MVFKIFSTLLVSALASTLVLASGPRQQCVETYKVASGDTCASIGAWSGLSASQIEAINPGVNCQSLSSLIGHSLCLEVFTPTCTLDVTVKSGDTCASLEKTWGLTQATLTALNDNLNDSCTNLVIGQQYCVSVDECFPGNHNPCCATPEGPGCP